MVAEHIRHALTAVGHMDRGSRGPRIVTDETKAEMKRILEEIRSGEFARQWILENKAGAPAFKATRRREREHPVETVGLELCKLMSWIDEREV